MAVAAVLFTMGASPDKYWSHLFPGTIVEIGGMTCGYTGCTITMMEGTRPGEVVVYTSFQVGATVGLAVISSIIIRVNSKITSQDPSALFKGTERDSGRYWGWMVS
ncbi:hypothetical protein C8J56DRAFT_353608 [Mycena floridula]|nr:hypothetical protein C8J56DRAFT_353608 [Mycena floridula]